MFDMEKTTISYFKVKNTTVEDCRQNGDERFQQTSLNLIVSDIFKHRISQRDAYLYTCANQNSSQIETEFTKFRTWVSELSDERCRTQLTRLLFPLFVHLYLDTMTRETNNQLRQAAMSFFRRHQALFIEVEPVKDLVTDIGAVFKECDVETKPLVRAFRSVKVVVQISSTSASLLRTYLTRSDDVILLLTTLNTWITFMDPDSNVREDDDPSVCPESEMIMGRRVENENMMEPEDFETSRYAPNSEFIYPEAVVDLINSFKPLKDLPPKPEPLLFLKINNLANVTCGSIDHKFKMVAVGNMDSSISVITYSEDRTSLPATRSLPVRLGVPNHEPVLFEPKENPKHFSLLRGHCESVSCVKFMNDCDIILSTSHDKTMRAWRGDNFSCAAVYEGHRCAVWALDISQLDMYVGTASRDCSARLWTLDRTHPLRSFVGHLAPVTCIKFHPNCTLAATGSVDKTIRLYSLIDGSNVRLFTGHTGPVHCLSFSPNGIYLASGGDYNEVIVWETSAGKELMTIKTDAMVSDLSWSLDSSETDVLNLGSYKMDSFRLLLCQFQEKNDLVCVGVK